MGQKAQTFAKNFTHPEYLYHKFLVCAINFMKIKFNSVISYKDNTEAFNYRVYSKIQKYMHTFGPWNLKDLIGMCCSINFQFVHECAQTGSLRYNCVQIIMVFTIIFGQFAVLHCSSNCKLYYKETFRYFYISQVR